MTYIINDLLEDYTSALLEYETSETCDPAQFRRQREALYDAKFALSAAIAKIAEDAKRYQWFRKGEALTISVPTPSEDKPLKKVTIIYGTNTEPLYGESLDKAIDTRLEEND